MIDDNKVVPFPPPAGSPGGQIAKLGRMQIAELRERYQRVKPWPARKHRARWVVPSIVEIRIFDESMSRSPATSRSSACGNRERGYPLWR